MKSFVAKFARTWGFCRIAHVLANVATAFNPLLVRGINSRHHQRPVDTGDVRTTARQHRADQFFSQQFQNL